MDFVTVGLLRVVVPLLILRRPMPGLVAAILVDHMDWRLLDMDGRSEADQSYYQVWDKGLDTYYLALAAAVSLRWRDPVAARISSGLFLHRAAGLPLFMMSGQREILVFFPNVFELYFMFFYAHRFVTGRETMFGSYRDAIPVLLALLAPQLCREYFLHIAEDRPWNMVRILPGAVDSKYLVHPMWAALFFALPVVALVRLTRANGTPVALPSARLLLEPRRADKP